MDCFRLPDTTAVTVLLITNDLTLRILESDGNFLCSNNDVSSSSIKKDDDRTARNVPPAEFVIEDADHHQGQKQDKACRRREGCELKV